MPHAQRSLGYRLGLSMAGRENGEDMLEVNGKGMLEEQGREMLEVNGRGGRTGNKCWRRRAEMGGAARRRAKRGQQERQRKGEGEEGGVGAKKQGERTRETRRKEGR
jgi:hypothetical protein